MAVNITVLKVINAGCFWAKENPSRHMSEETRQFMTLCNEINDYCNSTELASVCVQMPQKGQMCLAWRSEDRRWYRGRVLSIMQTRLGPHVKCFLIDIAETVLISSSRLREAPPMFLKFPSQAKKYSLFGLKPLTLVTSPEDFSTTKQPCNKWDTAADEFIFNLVVTDVDAAKVDVCDLDEHETRQVILYVHTSDGWVNINKMLVKEEYAVAVDDINGSLDQSICTPGESNAQSLDRRSRTLLHYMPYGDPSSDSKLESSDLSSPVASQGVPAQEEYLSALKTSGVVAEDVGTANREFHLQKTMTEHSAELREEDLDYKKFKKDCDRRFNREFMSTPHVELERFKNATPTGLCKQENIDRESSGDGLQKIASGGDKQEISSPGKKRGGLTALQKTLQQSHAAASPTASFTKRELYTIEEQMELKDENTMATGSDGREREISRARNEQDELMLRATAERNSHQLKGKLTKLQDTSDQKMMSLSNESSTVSDVDNETTVCYPDMNGMQEEIWKELYSTSKELSPEEKRETPERPKSRLPHHAVQESRLSPHWRKEKRDRDETRQSPQPVNQQDDLISPDTSLAKLIGQRIMMQLSGPNTDSAESVSKNAQLSSQVLVSGELKLRPITGIERAPFCDLLKQPLEELGFAGPTLVQAYAWPAILRGRDFVGISSRGSGKTLAYLLPVMTQLLQASTYASLPPGEGPLAVILSPSWKRAQFIYDNSRLYLEDCKTTRHLVIFGAGSEENLVYPLLNGCELLVATPNCLLRMLEKGYTSLRRLCHLVFDDADILVDDFTLQLKEIMKHYGKALSIDSKRSSPRQVIIMSPVWSVGIKSLVDAYLTDQLVAITSKVEAAIFGQVKQVVRVCHSNQRYTELLDSLDTALNQSNKTIIFTSNKSDAMRIQQLLNSYSHFTLLAHHGLMGMQLDHVVAEWKAKHRDDSKPILVMADDVIRELAITDATCIIHYDFPSSKQKFGNRLGCMSGSFAQDNKESSTAQIQCSSVLLVTETCQRHIPALVCLLKRMGRQAIPKQLEDMLAQATQIKEIEKRMQPLCSQLKAYGTCRDAVVCDYRHQVFPDLDAPKLPITGFVKVLITHVVDATHFYARILEHRASETSQPSETIATQYVELSMQMALWYNDPSNKVIHANVRVDELCAVEDKRRRTFQRVRVSLVQSDVKVHYIDEGRSATVEKTQLLVLPLQFHDVPSQVVEVFACRVKPVDQDPDWTVQASYHVYELISGKQMDGKIVLCLGKTLWLDPLLERTALKELNAIANANNVRRELLKNGFGLENHQHIEALYNLCEDVVPYNKTSQNQETIQYTVGEKMVDVKRQDGEQVDEVCSGMEAMDLHNRGLERKLSAKGADKKVQVESFGDSKFCKVYVVSVESPELFYVHLKDTEHKLEELMKEINTADLSHCSQEMEFHKGDFCLAVFSLENRWNRGVVTSVTDTGCYDVFFVDYGDNEVVSRDNIRPIPNAFLELPFQAIQCKLWNVCPAVGMEWPESAGDAMWNLSTDQDNKKVMFAKVFSKEKLPRDSYTDLRYKVELHDSSTSHDVIMSQELMYHGHAVGSPDSVKVLFPQVRGIGSFLNLQDSSLPSLLPDLCAGLYLTQELVEKVQVAEFVCQIVTDSDTDLVLEHAGVSSIVTVLDHCGIPEVQESLLSCLEILSMKSSSACREICSVDGIQLLCRLLWRNCEETIVELVLKILANVAFNDRSCSEIAQKGGILAIVHLLPQMKTDTCIVCALDLLTSLATHVSFDGTRLARQVVVMASQLVIGKSHQVRRSAIKLLKTLCSHEKTKKMMEKQGIPVAIQKSSSKMKLDEETQELCRDFLQLFQVPRAKTPAGKSPLAMSLLKFIKEKGAMKSPPDQRLISQGVKVERASPSSTLDSMPMLNAPAAKTTVEYSHPKVKWSQRGDTVLLSVQLEGVQSTKLTVEQDIIHFSTTMNGRHYRFDLQLYGNIAKYSQTLTGREVLITLYKEEPCCKWPRLVKSKQKVLYVSVDFERWEDEDSDSDKAFEKQMLQKTSRKINASFLDDSDVSDSDEDDDDDDEDDRYGVESDKVIADDLNMGLFGGY